jgi:hypothetical protein
MRRTLVSEGAASVQNQLLVLPTRRSNDLLQEIEEVIGDMRRENARKMLELILDESWVTLESACIVSLR